MAVLAFLALRRGKGWMRRKHTPASGSNNKDLTMSVMLPPTNSYVAVSPGLGLYHTTVPGLTANQSSR